MSGKPYPTAPPGPGAYPQQSPYPIGGYPQAPYPVSYPYQQPYGTPGPAQYTSPNPPPYQQAPPPYSQFQPCPPQTMYAPQYAHPQPQTVIAPGLFDSGARFDGISQARIPPPPPGVAPSAAQMAAMQGHTVVGTQESSNWLSGGRNDGGFSWGF